MAWHRREGAGRGNSSKGRGRRPPRRAYSKAGPTAARHEGTGMLLTIAGVLNAAQLDKIRESLADAPVRRRAAHRRTGRGPVKNNEELEPDPRIHQRITRVAMSRARPQRRTSATPRCRTHGGLHRRALPAGDDVRRPCRRPDHGQCRAEVPHRSVDDAVPEPARELRRRRAGHPLGVSGIAASAGGRRRGVYPSSSVHQVAPVTRASGW